MAVFCLHPVKAITSGEGGHGDHAGPGAWPSASLAFRQHGIARDPERCSTPRRGRLVPRAAGTSASTTASPTSTRRSAARSCASSTTSSRARNAVADRYREALAGVDGIELPPAAPGGALHAYHLFVIQAARRRGTPPAPLRRAARHAASSPRSTTCPSTGTPTTASTSATRRASARSRALLRGLPLAALLPDADRRRPGTVVEVVREVRSDALRTPRSRRASTIGGRWVGRREPTYVIAEAGANHNRDLGDRAAADRRRRRARAPTRSSSRPTPAETLYSTQDAPLRVPRGRERAGPAGAARGDRAAARVAEPSWRDHARGARHPLLLDALRPRGGRRARRARRPRAQDRLVRDRRPRR